MIATTGSCHQPDTTPHPLHAPTSVGTPPELWTHRIMLRQCRRGELLGSAQGGDRNPDLARPGHRPRRGLHLHRDLLQPPPPAQTQNLRLSHPGRDQAARPTRSRGITNACPRARGNFIRRFSLEDAAPRRAAAASQRHVTQVWGGRPAAHGAPCPAEISHAAALPTISQPIRPAVRAETATHANWETITSKPEVPMRRSLPSPSLSDVAPSPRRHRNGRCPRTGRGPVRTPRPR